MNTVFTNASSGNPHAAGLRDSLHAHCFACSPHNEHGLSLSFHSTQDGVTTGTWQPSGSFQSYDGRIHGGILATLMDSAMVHTLFARGIAGVTAEITVRYLNAVNLASPVEVAAWLTGEKHGLYLMQGEMRQDGRVAAKATAKFMAISGPGHPQ